LKAVSGQFSAKKDKRKILWLVSKLGWETPVPAHLSQTTIFVPKYNLGTSGRKRLADR
jgi:hypothetical protein